MRKCRTRKVRHHSKRAAQAAYDNVNNHGLNVYKCDYCHGWHLGTSNQHHKIQARIDQLLTQPKRIISDISLQQDRGTSGRDVIGFEGIRGRSDLGSAAPDRPNEE